MEALLLALDKSINCTCRVLKRWHHVTMVPEDSVLNKGAKCDRCHTKCCHLIAFLISFFAQEQKPTKKGENHYKSGHGVRACFIFSLSTLMMLINCTYSSRELSNTPKTSPKCIHNSTVHDEALTMFFIMRTLLNLPADSRTKRWVLLLSSPQAAKAVACANHCLQSYFFHKEFFGEFIVF